MKTSEMIKSNYIRSEDLKGQPPIVLTIADVSPEDIGGDEKYVMWFHESQKGLVLNVTKIRQLEAAYGTETEFWSGHRIKIKHDPAIMFAGQARGGLVIVCSTAGRQAPPAAVVHAEGPPKTIRQQADEAFPRGAETTSSGADPEFDDDIDF
jgi:hypothetical protein